MARRGVVHSEVFGGFNGAACGDRITDYGSSYAQGQATHSMTMYKAPSGALVFGAGIGGMS